MRPFLLAAIRGYQRWISPALPASCRFEPTCSAYAIRAIERHGTTRGAMLTARRLVKCHPFHPGGYDPVPEKTVTGCRSIGVSGTNLEELNET